jgi:hypothetical protein
MRRTNGLAGVLLPLMLALFLAGCTGSGDDDGIASAGGDATEAPESGDEELTEEEIYEQQLAFAACLREHGVDVEDPAMGEPFTIQGREGELEPAMEACQHLQPQGGGPGGGPADPEMRERMLEFAQCMRDNGVESFPDPNPEGGIQIGPDQADDPQFEAAQELCNEDVLGGEPPTVRQGGSDT